VKRVAEKLKTKTINDINCFRKEHDMFESIDKIFMAGLGAMSMTREKAEQIFDEYVKRGQAEQAAGQVS